MICDYPCLDTELKNSDKYRKIRNTQLSSDLWHDSPYQYNVYLSTVGLLTISSKLEPINVQMICRMQIICYSGSGLGHRAVYLSISQVNPGGFRWSGESGTNGFSLYLILGKLNGPSNTLCNSFVWLNTKEGNEWGGEGSWVDGRTCVCGVEHIT